MAEVNLTVTDSGPALSEFTPTGNTVAGTADGAKFLNTGKERIRIGNTSGAATRDVVFVEQSTEEYIGNITKTIPLSDEKWFGPFPPSFSDASGYVHLTYDPGNESDMNAYVVRFWTRNP